MDAQLKVEDLHVGFKQKKSSVNILNGVSFQVYKGETLCIVGESGCGKSLTSLSIMGLLPKQGEVQGGKIEFEGENLVQKNMKQMSRLRGNDLSMIFQEPMTSLNPVHTVGKQVAEVVRTHRQVGKKEAYSRALEMFELVGIPSPAERLHNYPHELSGGMRQRVMIAMALACNPKLLIADEPTTALDVTIQAQILELLNDIKAERQMSIMMITHDLGVVSEVADRVLVMYAGEVIECANNRQLFNNPQHPYTQGLIASIPKLKEEKDELPIIEGSVPSPEKMPKGCRFSTRCPFAKQECLTDSPPLQEAEEHTVRCWMHTDRWEEMTPWKGVDEDGREATEQDLIRS
ncbi:ABC transporter ATP-binding protein [Halalkalibacillus halophilus]|uniref:ABC transporter ATP-binding protein n=1 Tax=Halalkalibacillus halophilus TaxID=392827 RepID=UPI00054D6951